MCVSLFLLTHSSTSLTVTGKVNAQKHCARSATIIVNEVKLEITRDGELSKGEF